MQSLGVAVLQQVTWQGTTYTYFDTEAKGKYVLGLVYREGGMPGASGSPLVTHLSPVIWDGAAVSASGRSAAIRRRGGQWPDAEQQRSSDQRTVVQ